MEDSLNLSSSEPTFSEVKSIFKKPKQNVIQAFEVSLSESTTVDFQNNKSDADLDERLSTNKIALFKKPQKFNQESFSVSSDESILNSEFEQSVTFVKPGTLFTKANPSSNPFHVSYDETIGSVTQEVLSKSISSFEEDSTTFLNKSNPFKRKNKIHNEIPEKEKHVMEISCLDENKSEEKNTTVTTQMEQSGKNLSFDDTSLSGVESTTFVTKTNPFKRTNKHEKENSLLKQQLLQISLTEENIARETSVEHKGVHEFSNTEKTVGFSNDVNISEDLETNTSVNKPNPFKKKEPLMNSQNPLQISSPEEEESEANTSLGNNVLIDERKQSPGNVSFDKSISKLTNKSNNSGLYLDQSSINDENLNNWMSDHSDEELPPPNISKPKFSLTGEKPVEKLTSPVKTNALPSWEQKFQEIVANSKKSQMKLSDKISNLPNKKTAFKKPEVNSEKPLQQSNKYKPPRLNKPASFATKRLYQYIIKKLEPKYGIDAIIEAEKLVSSIADTVKKVTRRKSHQKKLIQDLKKEMALAGVIETTVDFYEFVIKFLPYNFRVKIVPCVQPVTNTVYPPKEVVNPFDKIL